jgi:LPS export ABC transporter protein LptC
MIGRRHEWVETVGLVVIAAAMVWSVDTSLGRRNIAVSGQIEPGGTGPVQHPRPAQEPDVVITAFHFLHIPTDPTPRSVWELTASSAELSESHHVAVLNEIVATLTPQQDGAVVTLTGERGQLDLQRMDFEVVGGSRPLSVRFDGRYQLTTSRLLWEDRAGLLTTDQPIELTGGELTITGVGLRWSSADGTASILQRVQMMIVP